MERDNQQWVADLREPGPRRDAALNDLALLLARGLHYALRSYSQVSVADVDDFVQEALLKVLAGLDSFRGDSRFVTWAQKIAVHVAISELRRARWRDMPLAQDGSGEGQSVVPERSQRLALNGQVEAGPERQAVQQAALDVLVRALRQDLTDRQREALTSVLVQEQPIEDVARRMGIHRNALYKLLHDARQRLKKQLLAEGTSAREILAAFEVS
jgi:RNA polymerase sigma-70 factor (ECF subfamily)